MAIMRRLYESATMEPSRLGASRAMTVTLHLAKPVLKGAVLRNVAGILKGSDPALRNQYVLLTAHYDHLGKSNEGIYYGANDNASGTVSVIEIARALAVLHPHPKRSILFMALFGEEEGLLGSYYFTHHPLVPLRNTVANVNLEQMGRTDERTGREVAGIRVQWAFLFRSARNRGRGREGGGGTCLQEKRRRRLFRPQR